MPVCEQYQADLSARVKQEINAEMSVGTHQNKEQSPEVHRLLKVYFFCLGPLVQKSNISFFQKCALLLCGCGNDLAE